MTAEQISYVERIKLLALYERAGLIFIETLQHRVPLNIYEAIKNKSKKCLMLEVPRRHCALKVHFSYI